MIKDLEQRWKDIVLGNTQGLLPKASRFLLQMLSWPYSGAVAARNAAFDFGLFKSHLVTGALVISVGNIVAGGTGKTPFILLLGEALKGLPIAILSRGYRSPAEKKKKPTILSLGQGPLHGPEICGDEPFLLCSGLPDAIVIVGQDRKRAAQMAVEAGAKVLLLDDGMQHRRVARDIEIVLLDAADPFGLGYHLPRGFLRENVNALARADLVVVNHIQGETEFYTLQAKIRRKTQAPVIATQLKVSRVEHIHGGQSENLNGRKVGLFCGIGKPEKFRETIDDLGATVVAELIAPDHIGIDPNELQDFAIHCQLNGAEFLVCTEKDKVKIPTHFRTTLPIVWVGITLEVVYGQEIWETFLLSLRNREANSKKVPINR